MTDPFLCPECQKLGYCRKYRTSGSSDTTYINSELYKRVHNKDRNADTKTFQGPVKVTSLAKIRAQFEPAKEETMEAPHILINSPSQAEYVSTGRLASLVKYHEHKDFPKHKEFKPDSSLNNITPSEYKENVMKTSPEFPV